jgi:hypothetical protein
MNPRLLIIEDERPMRTALADALAAEGSGLLTWCGSQLRTWKPHSLNRTEARA